MNILISYKEIIEQVAKKFIVNPAIEAIDEKTVEVSYKPASFFLSISVRFHIESAHNDLICMTYDCSPATAVIVSGLVAQFENRIPSQLEVNTAEKRVSIYPRRFEKLEKVLEYVSLSDIVFEQEAVNVQLTAI